MNHVFKELEKEFDERYSLGMHWEHTCCFKPWEEEKIWFKEVVRKVAQLSRIEALEQAELVRPTKEIRNIGSDLGVYAPSQRDTGYNECGKDYQDAIGTLKTLPI